MAIRVFKLYDICTCMYFGVFMSDDTKVLKEIQLVQADIISVRDDHTKTLDGLIERSDIVFDEVAVARKKLQDKFADIVSNITITNDDTSKEIEAKVSLLKAYDDILTSREKAYTQRITIRQKQKSVESNHAISEVVTEMLKNIDVNKSYTTRGNKLSKENMDELDKRFADLDRSVGDV